MASSIDIKLTFLHEAALHLKKDDPTIAEHVQPVLVEVNYSPDLETALAFYPSFVDDLFRRLFLGEEQQGGCGEQWDLL